MAGGGQMQGQAALARFRIADEQHQCRPQPHRGGMEAGQSFALARKALDQRPGQGVRGGARMIQPDIGAPGRAAPIGGFDGDVQRPAPGLIFPLGQPAGAKRGNSARTASDSWTRNGRSRGERGDGVCGWVVAVGQFCDPSPAR
jgi:hypothetical protein